MRASCQLSDLDLHLNPALVNPPENGSYIFRNRRSPHQSTSQCGRSPTTSEFLASPKNVVVFQGHKILRYSYCQDAKQRPSGCQGGGSQGKARGYAPSAPLNRLHARTITERLTDYFCSSDQICRHGALHINALNPFMPRLTFHPQTEDMQTEAIEVGLSPSCSSQNQEP